MKPALLLSFILALSATFSSAAQNPYLMQDPDIKLYASEVSADSIEQYITTLVGFHTRHNLSAQSDSERGIGAAATWLEEKISGWIPSSKVHLSVQRQSYSAGGKGTRLGRTVTLENIVATIQGVAANNRSGSPVGLPSQPIITEGATPYEAIDKSAGAIPEILLLAHYDSRVDDNNDSTSFAPGANDNGSGVACLLEIVRVLSAAEPLPVTVRCAFLSGEEHGLLGAQALAELSKKEGRNIIAVINNDMIGNIQASETNQVNNTYVRVFSDDTPARELARYIKETAEKYVDNITVKLIYRNDRYGRGGDHSPFAKQGYSAVRICEYHENYNRTHKKVDTAARTANGNLPRAIRTANGNLPSAARAANGNLQSETGTANGNLPSAARITYGDLPSGVDFEYVRKNTCVNLASVINLALAPKAPESVKMNTHSLSNFTEISWQGSAYAYYILMRETDQSTWTKALFVKGALEAKLPYSKDNYFFAVQAVDEQGHESLPVQVR